LKPTGTAEERERPTTRRTVSVIEISRNRSQSLAQSMRSAIGQSCLIAHHSLNLRAKPDSIH
jgi:hypothetical protein